MRCINSDPSRITITLQLHFYQEGNTRHPWARSRVCHDYLFMIQISLSQIHCPAFGLHLIAEILRSKQITRHCSRCSIGSRSFVALASSPGRSLNRLLQLAPVLSKHFESSSLSSNEFNMSAPALCALRSAS